MTCSPLRPSLFPERKPEFVAWLLMSFRAAFRLVISLGAVLITIASSSGLNVDATP